MISRIGKTIRIIGILIMILQFTNCSDKNGSKKTGSNNDDLYFDIAKNHIEFTLKEKVIFEKFYSKNGDWTITFSVDTAKIKTEDYIKEYFNLERKSLIKGDLNNDNIEDFAIRNIWGPEMGNLFGLSWLIFINSKDEWISIDNVFGGGKFSDIEDIKAINKGIIETSLTKLDKETLLHKNSSIVKYYKFENGSFTSTN